MYDLLCHAGILARGFAQPQAAYPGFSMTLCVLRVKAGEHIAAEPQPNSTSAAKAEFKKLRYGRAEARPSKTGQVSLHHAKKSNVSSTEVAEDTECGKSVSYTHLRAHETVL